MLFFSLHGLSEQMCDYILAAVIFEGKEFGFNSRGSEYVGEAT